MASPRSPRSRFSLPDTHDNPVTHISDPSWGKGVPYTRHRIYFVKPTSKFSRKIGKRQISKAWAKLHPRSVTYRYAYVSKDTGRRIPPVTRISRAGEAAWVQQGFLESATPKNLKKPSSKLKWAKNLYKTLVEYRRANLPPEGSDDLDRFMEWVQDNRADFYDALVTRGLAPKDPSYFSPASYEEIEAQEIDENE
jgi:hypothetical protein